VTGEDDARVRARELYGLAPEGFIEGRAALARQLAEGGESELAAAIKKLRKPTLVAWAVNVAARPVLYELWSSMTYTLFRGSALDR